MTSDRHVPLFSGGIPSDTLMGKHMSVLTDPYLLRAAATSSFPSKQFSTMLRKKAAVTVCPVS